MTNATGMKNNVPRNIILGLIVIGITCYFGSLKWSNANPMAPPVGADGEHQAESSNTNTSNNRASVDSTVPTIVGRQVCRECHAENYQLHTRHGHASTFASVRNSDLVQQFAGKTFDAGEEYGTYQYTTDSNGDLFVSLPSRFKDRRFPLQYVLGSGLHAQTMLTLVPGPQNQSLGVEHRVSCYSDGRLALTPSHSQKKPRTFFEYYGDSFAGEPLDRCVYCHITQGTVASGEVHDLIANVNCEKCHGPGSEHVRLARTVKNPPPFSVGKATWDAESELQLCGDCHRLPRDSSEKEIRDYSKFMTRFQPVGMVRSRCYLESDRELRCSTCHNVHQSIEEQTPQEHVQNCLGCHSQETKTHVACPVEPDSGCIKCHMPSVEVDAGLRFHDHWIRVHKD